MPAFGDAERFADAGMLDGSSSRLEVPLVRSSFGVIITPGSVTLHRDENDKEWLRLGTGTSSWRGIDEVPGVLRDFLKLRHPRSHGRDAAKYAERWGGLGLCVCGRPRDGEIHVVARQRGLCRAQGTTSFVAAQRGWKFQEPVDAWRRYALEAHAIVTLAADLYQGRRGDAERWAALEIDDEAWLRLETWRITGLRELATMTPDERHWSALAYSLNRWLRLAPSTLTSAAAQGTGGGLRLGLDAGAGVLRVVAQQLAMVSARAHAIEQCAECHEPFFPRRKVRVDAPFALCEAHDDERDKHKKRHHRRQAGP